jgi:hypothetical protein
MRGRTADAYVQQLLARVPVPAEEGATAADA